jgi:hypothetical protein
MREEHDLMSHRAETPFDNIECSHEYVSLLAEAVEQAMIEVESDIALADADSAQRRREALQLVHYNLKRLTAHMTSSRRILNDLRSLRRLLLEERTLPRVSHQSGVSHQSAGEQPAAEPVPAPVQMARHATARVGDNR